MSTVVVPHKLATFKQGPALGTETVSYVDKATLLLWDSVAAKAGELQGQGSAKGVHGREGMGQWPWGSRAQLSSAHGRWRGPRWR